MYTYSVWYSSSKEETLVANLCTSYAKVYETCNVDVCSSSMNTWHLLQLVGTASLELSQNVEYF